MGDYYCTNCGADLEDQPGFSPYLDYWTCTECGQFLTNPEDSNPNARYENVSWCCDKCGAYLNKQSGFSDWYSTWTCTECGYMNNISEDEIYDSEEDYQENTPSRSDIIDSILNLANTVVHAYADAERDDLDEDEDEDENEYDYDSENDYYDDFENEYDDDFDGDTDAYCSSSEYVQKMKEAQCKAEYDKHIIRERKKERRTRIWRTITRKKLRVGISSAECKGMNYEDVIQALKGRQFYKINTTMLEDLTLSSISREGMVESISINKENTFDAESMFPFNAKIEIVYHMLQRVSPPLTVRGAKKKNIQDVVKEFLNAGFVNIEQVEIPDLTIGWVIKEGSVETVTIDGFDSFKKNEKFRLDAKINIRYHTFKKKRI